MKRRGAIKHKLKQVIFRHRSKYVEEGLKRRPANCSYNAPIQVYDPSTTNKAVLRVCLYDVSNRRRWNNATCDESLGGLEQCRKCPMFKARNEADDLKAEFATMLGIDGTEVDIGWIAKQYPDVAALMWVLGSEPQSDEPPPPVEDKRENILTFFGSTEMTEDEIPEEPLADE